MHPKSCAVDETANDGEWFPQEVELIIKANGDVLIADESAELHEIEPLLGKRADAVDALLNVC